jgi:hypothetical protein
MLHRLRGDDDAAFRDFEAAGALGSQLARAEAAKLNPYAKLCNAMLTEMFQAHRTAPGPS